MGRTTAGQHTKAANQIMFAGAIIGLCEGLIYGYQAGLKLEDLIKLLSGGAAGSYTLKKHGPKMLNRDFEPGFLVEHFVQDLKIALDAAKRMKL